MVPEPRRRRYARAQAAVQLDLQYIGADRGHLHAFLPLHSGMSTEAEPDH
jgi:hypothetical protein